jgi:hypothetical protein
MAILLGKEVKLLGNAVDVDAFSASAQAVYTAPAANKVAITQIVLRCTAASGVTVPCTAKVEINPAAGDVFAAEVLVGVLTVDDQWTFTAESRGLVIPAGAQVDVTVTNAATGTSQTLSADVLGYIVY